MEVFFMIQSLQQSVQSVINEGRIGSPVFLRCIVQAPDRSMADTVGGDRRLGCDCQ